MAISTADTPQKWSKAMRLIHWSVAFCVVYNLFIDDEGDLLHNISGYVCLALILVRLYLGFSSTTIEKHSFKNFPSPNWMAACSYILFWLLILSLAVTGFLLTETETYWGSEKVEELHTMFANGIKIYMVLHFAGLVIDSIRFKRNTLMGMITGTTPNKK